MEKVIAFLKRTPEFAQIGRLGGQFNGYLLIPKEYSNIELPEPHGGITFAEDQKQAIKDFINRSETFWESGNIEHLDYSKYFCVGFDTLHYVDRWEDWKMCNVWQECIRWKEEVITKLWRK